MEKTPSLWRVTASAFWSNKGRYLALIAAIAVVNTALHAAFFALSAPGFFTLLEILPEMALLYFCPLYFFQNDPIKKRPSPNRQNFRHYASAAALFCAVVSSLGLLIRLGGNYDKDNVAQNLWTLGILPLCAILLSLFLYGLARLMLTFPAILAGFAHPLKVSWKLTKGNVLWMLGNNFLTMIILVMPIELLATAKDVALLQSKSSLLMSMIDLFLSNFIHTYAQTMATILLCATLKRLYSEKQEQEAALIAWSRKASSTAAP